MVHQIVHPTSSRSCKIYDRDKEPYSTSTIPYGAHNEYSTYGNSFQDHHTLCTSYKSKTGWSSTCTHKYFTEWTFSTVCTCPQATEAGLQTRELLALRKVKYPHDGRTSVNRLPLTKQDILSHYSNCFEGIEHFPGFRTVQISPFCLLWDLRFGKSVLNAIDIVHAVLIEFMHYN